MNFGHMMYDEDVVIKKLGEGDRETYRTLFETYYQALCLYATSLTREKSQAEDIVQNVFFNLWLKRDNMYINSSLKNYLYQSVYNAFINDFRRKKREENILDKIHVEVLQKSLEDEEHSIKKRLEWINQQIEVLPPKSRRIFEMNKKRGLTYKEIAKMLNVSENTVESHISRALKRIRDRIPEPLLLLLIYSKTIKKIED